MIDSRPDFYRATNKAYELLIENGTVIPPYPVIDIARGFPDCVAMTYFNACRKYGLDLSVLFADSDHGMTLKQGPLSIILFSGYKDRGITRFTVAHELGHVVLGHSNDDGDAEMEANCFARNLLCPALVAQELSIRSEYAYTELFNVSFSAAQTSFKMRHADMFNLSPFVRDAFLQKFRENQQYVSALA